MGRRFTEEQKQWIVENYCEHRSRSSFMDAFNEKFNEARGFGSFEGIVKSNCLKLKDKFTDEEQQFLDMLDGETYENKVRLFNERFGRNITMHDVRSKTKYRKLKAKEIRERDCVYCLNSCTTTGRPCASSANCYCRLEKCPYEL